MIYFTIFFIYFFIYFFIFLTRKAHAPANTAPPTLSRIRPHILKQDQGGKYAGGDGIDTHTKKRSNGASFRYFLEREKIYEKKVC